MRSSTFPALVAIAAAVALTGCSAEAADDDTVAIRVPAATTTAAAPTEDGDGSDSGTGNGGTGNGATDDGATGDAATGDDGQSLPPGDPGVDAPGTDDPNGDLGGNDPEPESDLAKAAVPVSALLDAETVNSVAGAGWTLSDQRRAGDSCVTPVPAPAVGSRTATFTHPAAGGAAPGRLTQTVSTHPGRKAAIASVEAVGKRLARCAKSVPTDPRIGDASVEATVTDAKGVTSTVTAVAVEGVSFVLTGSGSVTAPDVWAALTDIAQGNSCEAAADGCH